MNPEQQDSTQDILHHNDSQQDSSTKIESDFWQTYDSLANILWDGDLADQEQKKIDEQEKIIDTTKNQEQDTVAMELKEQEVKPLQHDIVSSLPAHMRQQGEKALTDPFGYAQAYQEQWNRNHTTMV